MSLPGPNPPWIGCGALSWQPLTNERPLLLSTSVVWCFFAPLQPGGHIFRTRRGTTVRAARVRGGGDRTSQRLEGNYRQGSRAKGEEQPS
jgi:hypothetical protein